MRWIIPEKNRNEMVLEAGFEPANSYEKGS